MGFMGDNQSKPRLQVEAVVIPACGSCGKSPVINGVDQSVTVVHESARYCPHCKTKLPAKEDQGVVFDTRWDAGPFGKWKRKFHNYINTLNNPRRKKAT